MFLSIHLRVSVPQWLESDQKLNRPSILRSEGPMAGWTCLRVSLTRLATASPDSPSQWRADS